MTVKAPPPPAAYWSIPLTAVAAVGGLNSLKTHTMGNITVVWKAEEVGIFFVTYKKH